MDSLSTNLHHKLTCDMIKVLNDTQILTVLDFLGSESKQIEKITGLTLKEILEIRKEVLKKYSRPRCAYDYYQSILNEFAIIPTGITRLDSLLEGGLFTGNIYEVCGLPASGKTLFCFTLLKNVIQQGSEVVYFDTKCDFLGLKLKQMLSHLNKEDLVAAMNKVLVNRIHSKQDFLKMLLVVKHAIQSGSNIKLIIIDSLPPLCFTSTDQTENNAFLTYVSNILFYLAKEYNVVIVVTNLITLWNEGDFKNTDVMKEKIACGSFWYSLPNVRIILKKCGNLCKVTLSKTIKFIPEINTCDVQFTDEGFI